MPGACKTTIKTPPYFDTKLPGAYILGGFGLGRFITPMPKRPAVVKRQAARGVPPLPDALKGEGIAPGLIPIWGQNLFSPGYQPRLLLLSFPSESGLCPGLGAVQALLHPVL
mgnify:FL=1|jgi:hypothetical protein